MRNCNYYFLSFFENFELQSLKEGKGFDRKFPFKIIKEDFMPNNMNYYFDNFTKTKSCDLSFITEKV